MTNHIRLTDRRVINWPAVIEDLEFLAEHRVGLTEASRRVGVRVDTLTSRLPRLGRPELAIRLRAHEPINPTTHKEQ